MTPRTWGGRRRWKHTIAPRILKAPTGVWFSCLFQTSVPWRWHGRGRQYWGVGGIF
jgi:hypothetical protein